MSSIYFNLAPLALITSTLYVCLCVCVCVCVGWSVCVCVHPQRVNGVRLPVKADNKTTALAIIEFRVC